MNSDPAELLALVVQAKREALLRAHRHRLRRADLEDCYGQAAFELLRSVRKGKRFAGREHIARTFEQRFVSRVQDQVRATRGRSLDRSLHESALAFGDIDPAGIEVEDVRADIHDLVVRRIELRRLCAAIPELTSDQRLVLAAQVSDVGCMPFCQSTGWSREKYRKVAQRGRARLRSLTSSESVSRAGVASRVKA